MDLSADLYLYEAESLLRDQAIFYGQNHGYEHGIRGREQGYSGYVGVLVGVIRAEVVSALTLAFPFVL
jgi:hypothetical protein